MMSQQVQQLLTWLTRYHQPGTRVVIAVAGPPGAGKSTISEALVDSINKTQGEGHAVVIPMDGFHLTNEVLIERGRLDRKGAPDTFDVEGLISLVQRITQADADVRYPIFDRSIEASHVDAGLLLKECEVVVVEGNYLLLDEAPWSNLAPYFDLTVFTSPTVDELERRLIQRWLDHGYTQQQAEQKAWHNDLLNAKTVVEQSRKADLVFDQD